MVCGAVVRFELGFAKTIEEWEKRRLMSHDELVELGLLDRDHLVFSMVPLRRVNKPTGGTK